MSKSLYDRIDSILTEMAFRDISIDDDETEYAYDAMIVLGHDLSTGHLDSVTQRSLDDAIMYFRVEQTPCLVVSGGQLSPNGVHYSHTIADRMKAYLLDNDVPEEAILVEKSSLDLLGQLLFTKALCVEAKLWDDVAILADEKSRDRIAGMCHTLYKTKYAPDVIAVENNSTDPEFCLDNLNRSSQEQDDLYSFFRQHFKICNGSPSADQLTYLFSEHELYSSLNPEHVLKLHGGSQ